MSITIKKKCALFTVCSVCYLPKALVLAESVYKFDGRKLIIYMIDRKIDLPQEFEFAEIRWIEDESIPKFKVLSFIYDVTEFSTCVKPLLALRLLNEFSSVIFLDPDTCVFSSLDLIHRSLIMYPILVTPHYTVPISSKSENHDLSMMRFGSFNMGFFGVSDNAEAIGFLTWWSERCIDLCYFETQFGLSTDQKWVSIAPCFFPNLHIMFDLGLNMAFWNLHERALTKSEDDSYLVNGTFPLIFFHFSSFDERNPAFISSRPHPFKESGRVDLVDICFDYSRRLESHDHGLTGYKYGFDYMSDGSYISPTLRKAFSCVVEEMDADLDPFDSNGPMRKFIKKNYLSEKDNSRYRLENTADIGRYSAPLGVVYILMRILLKLIGPNKFTNFSRLLVYLSSYRQNRGLWKL